MKKFIYSLFRNFILDDIENMLSERLKPADISNDKNKDHYDKSADEYTQKIIEAKKKK